ncbi:MAG TPA: hypothetical protein VK797_31165 [Tepidisphaeraceae bacterium]|jgi:hypothetical protein|nr:hypothetical protein [Tepidisphaeraceae bacterium]
MKKRAKKKRDDWDRKYKSLVDRINKLEAKFADRRKKSVSRSQIEREHLAKSDAVRAAFMNTAPLMAMLATATTPAEQEEKIREWLKGICDRFAGKEPKPMTPSTAQE